MSEAPYSPQFDDLVAKSLDQVLHGRQAMDDVLQAVPEAANELRPLLQAAILTGRLKSPQMAPDALDALEQRLRMEMLAHEPQRARVVWLMPTLARAAAMIAITVLLLLGSGAGLVAASANTAPGDPLYFIKRLWEAIVLALTPLSGPPGSVWLWIGENRLNEVDVLAARGRLDGPALVELHRAIYWLSRYNLSGDAGQQERALDYLKRVNARLRQLQPPADARALYDELTQITQTSVERDQIIPPASELPASSSGAPPSPTPTVTAMPTATPEPSITPVPSVTPTVTLTASVTPTETPRIPPTATRTPTLTPTLTPIPPTATLTATVTMTWTPLPLPQLPTTSGSIPTLGPEVLLSSTPAPAATLNATERVRETQAAVYLTQTAGPPSTPEG